MARMQTDSALAIDANYVGADPELPYLDRFLLGAANNINDTDVQAFVRAGLFRSFTARKVTFVRAPCHVSLTVYALNKMLPLKVANSESFRGVPLLRPFARGSGRSSSMCITGVNVR